MTDQNFETMRRAMVAGQLRTNGVNDPRLVAVLSAVPRERFLPGERAAAAYIDRAIPLAGGRALNPPMTTALLLNEGAPRPSDRVLLIGAATGYTAALLADLVAQVVAVECDPTLAAEARRALADRSNVSVIEAPLEGGAAADAPFDLLVIDGAVEEIPPALIDQVVEGGRVATAVFEAGVFRLGIGRRVRGGFGLRMFADAEAVRLPGFSKPAGFRF